MSLKNPSQRKIALFLGRFQPFHNGHLQVVEQMERDMDLIKIAIGSAYRIDNDRNPFTLEQRKDMINLALGSRISVPYQMIGVPDRGAQPVWDSTWVKYLENHTGVFTHYYCGSDIDSSAFEKKGYIVISGRRDLGKYPGISATKVRNLLKSDDPNERNKIRNYVDDAVADYLERIDAYSKLTRK